MKTGLEKVSVKTRAASRARPQQTLVDGALQRRVGNSATMQRQREQIESSFGRPVQRAIEDEEELLQGKFTMQLQRELEQEELLQGKFTQPIQREQEAAPNQTGIPDNLKQGLESLSGLDMSDVRVHYNSQKPAQLNAHAYAQGSNIHLGPGQEQHLPHEAWHAVQQREGRVKPTMEMKGENINDDAGLEHEADVMGAKTLQYGKR